VRLLAQVRSILLAPGDFSSSVVSACIGWITHSWLGLLTRIHTSALLHGLPAVHRNL